MIQKEGMNLYFNPGCDRRFRTLYEGISTSSLWELLNESDNFPFPDYKGMEVSIRDPCPVRNTPAIWWIFF